MYTTDTQTHKPIISIIAAIAEKNRAIGKDNALLWQIPEDLTRFKKITSSHPIIMGRKTHESIGKPLPNRTNIVVTRNQEYVAEGCTIVSSLEDAIKIASEMDHQEIFIIGGGEIFKKGIDIADKLYLTLVRGDFEGDSFFPDYSRFTRVLSKEQHTGKGYIYTFIDLVK